ncbi:MAG: PorT family protein [Chitinophagales bacterium]|nr:PorT family protein [Chitinophagales bacterium]
MKNLLTLLISCSLTLSLNAQNKFEMGVEYFLNASWELDPIVDAYKAKLSHTAGLKIDYRFNEHWAVGSGIAYANFGLYYEQDGDDLRWGTQHDGQGGIDPSIPSGEKDIAYLQIRHVYHFIEIPLRVTYNTGGEGVRCYIAAGLAPRLFWVDKTKVELDLYDGSSSGDIYSDEGYDYSRLQLSVFTTCGVEFNIGAHTTFYTGPRIQMHRFKGKSETLNHSLTTDFMQLGLEMGVRF